MPSRLLGDKIIRQCHILPDSYEVYVLQSYYGLRGRIEKPYPRTLAQGEPFRSARRGSLCVLRPKLFRGPTREHKRICAAANATMRSIIKYFSLDFLHKHVRNIFSVNLSMVT